MADGELRVVFIWLQLATDTAAAIATEVQDWFTLPKATKCNQMQPNAVFISISSPIYHQGLSSTRLLCNNNNATLQCKPANNDNQVRVGSFSSDDQIECAPDSPQTVRENPKFR